ncbi:MAG TPA: 4-hydroxy-3-methylbut-2-enyl diphosphate reductase, partial [Verrucomicrobiae bacterium]|nr:4-hydroxy-3-methylbut-2-enyl diphosphate reductase [Verrucomicrobiae bacterium]
MKTVLNESALAESDTLYCKVTYMPRFKILRAAHLGMCFGVRDAISLALEKGQAEPLTILGELVHNPIVLDQLRSQGVQIEHQLTNVRTPTVMITAHGASEKAMSAVRERGLNVVEATCPLVHHAHRVVSRMVQDGYHPIIIGKRDHVEVRGLTEDLAEFDVVLSADDVSQLRERPKFGIAAQTTQPIHWVRYLVGLICIRFPNAQIRFIDTVCQPTKQRQSAAIELAQQSDVVVVIGGANSNNTRELVSTCGEFCPRVHHIQTAADLREDWFDDGVETVGLTAGTSTPDWIIDAVETRLKEFAELQAAPASKDWGF